MHMNTHGIAHTLAALALAGLAGSAHAAWGHSDYLHVEAYQHQRTLIVSGSAAAHPKSATSPHEYDMIRAFEPYFGEEAGVRARKVQRADEAPRRAAARS